MSLKFCMTMGLWALMTGKILWSGHLGNGCYGNEKHLESPEFGLFCSYMWIVVAKKNEERICIVMDTCVLSWQPICYHSNQKMSSREKDKHQILQHFKPLNLMDIVTVSQFHWLEPLVRGKALVKNVCHFLLMQYQKEVINQLICETPCKNFIFHE